MPLFTLISLVLGIFGASHALMSALRSRYDSELREIFRTYAGIVQEIKQTCNHGNDASSFADAHASRICRRQTFWNFATGASLWMFATAVLTLAIFALANDWSPPQVAQNAPVTQAMQNAPVNQWILDHVGAVKFFMGAYLVAVSGFFALAHSSSGVIVKEFKDLQGQKSTAISAIQAQRTQSITRTS